MPTAPPDNLVDPDELQKYGVPSAFLAQFRVGTIEINISTGGALGTMEFQWRPRGEDTWSAALPTDAGASFAYTLDEGFTTLTFAAGTYVVDTTYQVASDGTVTAGAGALDELAASRWDLRESGCEAATGEALALMKDGVTLPLTAWGAEVKRHAAALVYEFLKLSRGLSPPNAGTGDETILQAALNARRFFSSIGTSELSPPGLTDSAVSEDGPIMHYPDSDDTRGW